MTELNLSTPNFNELRRDLSFSAVLAGFIAVLVGASSSIGLVIAAAQAAHLTPAQTSSWIFSVYISIAVTGSLLSWRYRAPILTAWTTPGLALIATQASHLTLPEMIGAYLISAALITALGLSGAFERVTARIPGPLAAGLLAGVLIPFVLGAFKALPTSPLIVGAMTGAFLLGRAFLPRYAVPLSLAAGVVAALLSGQIGTVGGADVFGTLTFTLPHFTLSALLALALPMTLLTLASQNLPGVAVLRTFGYSRVPTTPLIWVTGLASLLSAPFGAHTTNLAAITAAIGAGEESHHDPARRYVAGLSSAFFYLLLGIFAGWVAGAVGAVPPAFIAALAGLALLGTATSSLVSALSDTEWREAAAVTVFVTASGLSWWGLGSALWGLILGGLLGWGLRRRGPGRRA
ncbi:benzoate/H(+) symporter BenE family transporter [Deinococcus rubellus]|uniref:Benzoate/H(+) symporter BenE family transporter n=1 Tax=Deinococcus rubellus TaxID=1889240 RepID=A0ABY5YD83_9DEIO|nr:benzoate/H(+) symporter BenE family transporter [Deinococcus rubellus]UWX62973.1 benzoate/H(+) symporter BenE family transporter [Deinococcus rubellus]